MNWSKTLLIDLDNVIHDMNKGWKDGKLYGKPVRGALESITRLQTHEFIVKVFTAREDLEPVRRWLKKYKINCEVTNVKEGCLAIIDDRAIRFTNWEDILRYFV